MLGDRAARARPEAGDDVHDTVGDAGFLDQLAQPDRGERRLLGRLQHDGIAAGERRRDFPRSHRERKVPWNYLSADPDRLTQRVVEG